MPLVLARVSVEVARRNELTIAWPSGICCVFGRRKLSLEGGVHLTAYRGQHFLLVSHLPARIESPFPEDFARGGWVVLPESVSAKSLSYHT